MTATAGQKTDSVFELFCPELLNTQLLRFFLAVHYSAKFSVYPLFRFCFGAEISKYNTRHNYRYYYLLQFSTIQSILNSLNCNYIQKARNKTAHSPHHVYTLSQQNYLNSRTKQFVTYIERIIQAFLDIYC